MKKIIITSMFSLLAILSYGQLKFFTDQGQTEIKEAKCGISDLTVRVPIPANLSTYDKAKFHVFLTPSSDTPLNPWSSPVYFAIIDKENYEGQKYIDLTLKNAEGTSDFTHRNSSAKLMNIEWPCNDNERSVQIFKISFELEGLKFQKYIVGTNGEQEPQYSATSLKKYPNALPFDYGVADPNISPEDKSFSVKKTYDVPLQFQTFSDEMTAFIDPIILFNVKSFKDAKVEEVKTDIVNRIKNNTLVDRVDLKFSCMIDLCYPCYAKKIKKSDNSDADNKMKEICANLADWKSAKVGGLDGFVLDISKTVSTNNWSASESKLSVDKDSEFPFKKLFVFVVESKGRVFVGTMQHNQGKPTSEATEKLFKDFFDSFKVN